MFPKPIAKIQQNLVRVYLNDGTFRTLAVTADTDVRQVCDTFGKKMRLR